MSTENKKKVSLKDVLIIVLVLALIAGLAFSFVSLNNARKDADAKAEALQQQLNKVFEQLDGKLDADENVSWDEIKAEIQKELGNITFPEGLDKAVIEEMIKDAIADIDFPKGITEKQVKDIVNAILANYDCGCDCLTKEELEQLIKDILEEKEDETTEATIATVTGRVELESAIIKPSVNTIILEADIVLDKPLVISKDVVIDMNGHKITTVAKVEHPDASTVAISEGCDVTFMDGKIVDVAEKVNGGLDFIRVFKGATLTLDNVTVSIKVTPEIYFNNTMDRWQSNSAEHNIIVIYSDAAVNLTDSDVTVVSPKVTNFSNYVRYRFSIVGVKFAQSSTNAKFVMDGGSFDIQITDPHAKKSTVDYTDNIYFVKADRNIATVPAASNTFEVKGNADITLGGPDEAGKIQTNNTLFWLGYGYYKGNTYYSGIKTITLAAGTNFNINGSSYTVKTASALDVKDICQEYGLGSAVIGIYDIEEIKYHFVCFNLGYGCTYEADLTLAEVAAQNKCPHCAGKLLLKD